MALSAVLLPAPFGPMRPRMRPSSTRKSTPSSATVVPKTLRRPRASMNAMASALLLGAARRRLPFGLQQFFRRQTEASNGLLDPRPLIGQELRPLGREQQIARARP